MAAAAITLADTLQLLLATQQRQAPDNTQPSSSSSSSSELQQVINCTAYVSRSVLDVYNTSISIAATIPAAAAAAARADAPHDFTIMLKDASMAAAAPIAQLALVLLRTPLTSSSSRVRSSSMNHQLERTVSHRRLELHAVIKTAAQLANAVAFMDPPLSTQQPAASSQLLMVNMAYMALYESGGKPRRRRQRQQGGMLCTSAASSNGITAG
jgi:hypothetical protein